MPRRLIYTANQINAARARNWEIHYSRRQRARELTANGWNAQNITNKLSELMPYPKLDLEAGIEMPPIAERKSHFGIANHLGWRSDHLDLLCIWYWTETEWMKFVHEFNNLPEVREAHYLFYVAETDQAVLVPMSSKPRKTTYKSGTSQVRPSTSALVVPELEPISPVSAPKKGVVPRRA